MSVAGTIGLPVMRGQLAGSGFGISTGHVDLAADGGRAHVDGVEIFLRVLEQLNLDFERRGEGMEFLTDGHRHGVLQFGAAHLGDFQSIDFALARNAATSF